MSEITKPILLNETGQETNQKLDTLAAKEQLIADAINNVAQNYTDIHAAAVSAQQQATAAAASAAAADNSADDAADSAAAAAQKLDDLETFLSGLDPESAASVAAELGLFEQEVASGYAKKDGYYEQMGVGTADNLAGHGSVNAEYTFRTAGGDSDIGTGAAAIDAVKGNTLVWNQLAKLTSYVNLTPNGSGVYTVENDNTDTWVLFNVGIENHKFLFIVYAIIPEGKSMSFCVPASSLNVKSLIEGKNTWLFTASSNNIVFDDVQHSNCSGIQLYNFQLFDLTKMFGSGYEPSTVTEFEALYPLDYYAYNAGTLINNAASGIKTIGFNAYNPSTGRAVVIKGHQYQITGTYTAIAYSDGTTITPDSNGLFTPTLNDELIVTGGNSTDTCVHLAWSGYRNGEYEPYQENTVYFDSASSGSLATIKGRKLNAQGEIDDPIVSSAAVFPDGMKSAGSVYDEIKGNVAIKRIGSVDLGTLVFHPYSATNLSIYNELFATVNNAKKGTLNMLCTKYTPSPNAWGQETNNSISIHPDSGNLYIYDTSINASTDIDSQGKVAKLNNVILYYELATPETYLLDNPLPSNYVVNDFGTEQRLPADTSSSVMAPILYSVQYAMNATDTIRRLPINYISKDSFENFCESLASAIGPYLNPPATIAVTSTYNDNTQEYDYQVTVTPTENNG